MRYEMPLISVLIPIYNVEPYIRECLESVLLQTYPNFEVVVVDDGSTDKSPQICKEYLKKIKNFSFVEKENKGVSSARNRCIQEAHGEYYTFIDGDDVVEKTYLSELFALCHEKNVPLSACNHWIEGKQKRKRFTHTSSQVITAYQACRNVLYHNIPDISLWGKLYAAKLFTELKFPEGQIYEDTYCIAELLLRAKLIAYTSTPLYHYRLRAQSISRGSFGKEKLEFLLAVEHLCKIILEKFPQLYSGCIRRKVHAALSVRRYLVNCKSENKDLRFDLEKMVKKNAWRVLIDISAPLRDKVAICSVLLGPKVYDALWSFYVKKKI